MDAFTLVAKLILDKSSFDASLSGVTGGLNSADNQKAFTVWGQAMGRLAGRAIETAIKASINFAKDFIQTGMEFDAMMSYVQAIGQMTDEQFQDVRERAIELGESTKFTATEVAEAFSYMALAGWDSEEMLAGIDGVLNLAAASGENLGRVSDIVTDALTAFGLEAGDSAHFVDVLAQASANSNTTVAQMGEAFKYIATTGGVMGYTIDDVAVALGLLANNGIKASQAGTSMRQILNTLIAPGKDAAEAMNDLGLSLFEEGTDKRKPLLQVISELRDIFAEADFNLEGQSMEEAMKKIDEANAWYDAAMADFEKKSASMSKKEQNAMQKDIDNTYAAKLDEAVHFNETFLSKLSAIGGLRGISSLFALMMASEEDYAQLVGSVEKSEGAAQTMAETMLDNLKGDITLLQSAMDGLKILVSDEFKGSFRDFVQELTAGVGEMSEAFSQGGLAGMLTNLAGWVIDGVTESLSNPNKQQVEDFGTAIGNFIGKVAKQLVTDLPALVGGIVTIGESLAGGLIEGLFKGLFGDDSDVSMYVDSLTESLNDIELKNVRANALLNYLDELAAKGDENLTKTEAWQTAVAQLEEIMPGVKEQLEAEGATLQSNIDKVRTMTDEFRKQAIHQAMVNTLQKEYELLAGQGVEREKEVVNAEIAQQTQGSILDTLRSNIQRYAEYAQKGLAEGTLYDLDGSQRRFVDNLLQGFVQVGQDQVAIGDLGIDQLIGVIGSLTQYLDQGPFGESIWETDQNYLSPEEIESLNAQYSQAVSDMQAANQRIADLNAEMDTTRASISTTERAVQSVSEELGITASGVGSAGSSVVSALNSVASEIGSISFPTGESAEGSHAKGLDYVPYDDYSALLHRGEMVLTASQARKFREGNNQNVDISALVTEISSAIKDSMQDVTVKSYLSGRDITDDVNRNTVRALKARRFAT